VACGRPGGGDQEDLTDPELSVLAVEHDGQVVGAISGAETDRSTGTPDSTSISTRRHGGASAETRSVRWPAT
jgi:hypothetical protein